MKNACVRNVLTAWALGSALGAGAQGVPGEDPVRLSAPVRYMNLPTAASTGSGQINPNPEMPAWMKAKVARYEAKSFSATANDGTIQTGNDVVNTANAQGLSKTCVQEVGSVTTTSSSAVRSATGGQPQIVVLRGDLVNVCR